MLAVALCSAGPALAEPDSFWLGTGRDGAVTVSSANTVINRYAQVTAPTAPGDTDIDVSSTTGFAAGDLVMIHQTTGLIPVPASGSSANVDLSTSPVGRWELARVSSVSTNQLLFTAPLVYSYAASVSQVIRVPEYTTVTVSSGASIVATPWNGSVGGIIAFLAQGSLTNNGTISAVGAGFRGATYVRDTSGSKGCSETEMNEPAARGAQKGEGLGNGPGLTGRGNIGNAGGGGICYKSGGGGGSNRGKGGIGGFAHDTMDGRAVGGYAGAPVLFDPFLQLVFGGGGGSGHGSEVGGSAQGGAAGGGIILIRANQLLGAGDILADGNAVSYVPTTDASGGGGGGGTVLARFVGSAACKSATAVGGDGGYTNASSGKIGPGGGGGGGYVRVQGSSVPCTVRAASGLAGSTIVGGLFQDYGATNGSLGLQEKTLYGLIQPAVPTLNEPVTGSATNLTKPFVSATYSGQGTAVVGVFVDGIESGTLTCNSSGNCTGYLNRGLTEGSHQIAVASRVDGLWSARTATRTFMVDLTVPAAPTVTSPVNGAKINDRYPLIQGRSEALSTVEIFIDGSSLGTATADSAGLWSFKPTTLLAEGNRSLQAKARDVAGNTGALSSAISITIDVTAPGKPTIIKPEQDSVTNVTLPTIEGIAESGSTVTIYIDDAVVGTTTSSSSTWSFVVPAPLAGKTYGVKATAKDAAGNVSPASSVTTFTVDTVRPDTTLDPASTPPNPSRFTAASFAFSSNEPGGSFECRLDTAAFAPCLSPYDVSGLAHGSHTVQVRAKDKAGNLDDSPASFSWMVDTVAPAAPVVTSPSAGASLSMLSFAGTAEAGSTVTVLVDGSSLGTAVADASGAWSFTSISDVTQGSHSVTSRATDAAGNVGPTSSAITFTWDTRAPDTTITSAPSGVVTSASATLTFTSEAGATFECSLDGSEFAACASPLNLDGLVDGTHNFKVRATDPAGNVDATPATASWVSDTGVPSVSIASGPAKVTNETSATFSFESNELGASFECGLDGAAFVVCSNPVTFTSLADGSHTLQVRAKDPVGNFSGAESWTWTVDTVVPETSITQKPEAQTQETSATFSFGSNETGGSFECKLDGGDFAPCTSPVTYSNLAAGSHTLQVRAKDAAGNVDASPESYSWTISSPTNPGDGGGDDDPQGCGCSSPAGDPSAAVMALMGLAAFVRRRRK